MNLPLVFLELGAATLGLAVLSRVASHAGISAIPFYLLAGLAFGNGGFAPLPFSTEFIHVGAEIGVVLLLFTLGLEYTGAELVTALRQSVRPGLIDVGLNFTAGLAAGLLLGWNAASCLAFAGITYISSSGIIAKVLSELRRETAPETKSIVSLLVFEDLVMAAYLPLLTVVLSPRTAGVAQIVAAVLAVTIALLVAVRFGGALSRLFAHRSDEIILLSSFGTVLLVAGAAQRLQVSAAVGAFLVGIAFSGPFAQQARRVIAPVRDLFAAVFFFFFGLQIAPAALVPVLPIAALIALVLSATKLLTGWWSLPHGTPRERLRAGTTLIARGEFSIVIAGLAIAAGAPAALGSIAAAFVLLTAIIGPIAARFSGGPAAVTPRTPTPDPLR
ncbi:MAG TPA: cation:proton antiporter [Thermoanaerobaculia bacterium]|jgi:CPA2 family monovalent cation:H+ antiporter-2